MEESVKVDKHLNLYKADVKNFEKMFGTEHGIFSRLTREMFHNFMEKARWDERRNEKTTEEAIKDGSP